ncbi:MAG: Rne/Rng family ribonuclease [Tissierellia bacterium]|nr:Rne/Rng family ribonuclease [Tissierellia bacterium]
MNYIFIDSKDGIEKVGIVEENKLVEFYIDHDDKDQLVGNIYRGRVVNVLQGMEAAFVDIGHDKNAYLDLKNALTRKTPSKEGMSIRDVVKVGQEIIVQVLKEPTEMKGAKITANITLPGRFIVLTPYSEKISISRKIIDEDEISRLKNIGEKIRQESMGMIFRTSSKYIGKDLLEEEYINLIDIFKKIERERNFLPCPKLIYKEMDLSEKVIRDSYSDKIDKIIVNNKDKYNRLLQLEDVFFPGLKEKMLFQEDFSIDYEESIMKGIKMALDRKVDLKCGGSVVIDETEALTVIDVNTGKFTGNINLKDTVVKTNLEAAEEIARQIRLRNLTGIIIIDFIDMKDDRDVNLVMERLEEHLNKDKNKANIIGITKLGLVELTRRKTRNSLSSNFLEMCPTCKGKGKIYKIVDK